MALAALAAGTLLSCAAHHGGAAAPPPEAQVLRYDASLRIEVETTQRRVAGRAPLPDDDPVAVALAPLSRTGLDARLVLELQPSRSFRDGSEAWTLRVVDAEAVVLGPSADPHAGLVPAGPAEGWTLAGRSVELRGFDDGELLAVADAEHVMGPDRLGESLDLLLPMVSPFPPELDDGEEGFRPARWPLMVTATRGWRHRFDARWENLGRADAHPDSGVDPTAWHLRYSGPTGTRGRDDRPYPPVGVQGRGQLDGEVWLSDVDRDPVVARVLRSDATWQREIEVEYPDAVGGPLRVVQTQRITASLRRSSP